MDLESESRSNKLIDIQFLGLVAESRVAQMSHTAVLVIVVIIVMDGPPPQTPVSRCI